ncbi:zinc finger, CCHC-type containing protein [Tanacetum coccineum]
MTEMFSLLKELTKSNSPEKVLVKEEVRSPITKYVNVVSLIRDENDKGIESDMVIDENVVELVKLVDNKEEMDEEEGNEPNGNVNEDSTRWGKYMDRLPKILRSLPIGYYLKHKTNEKTSEDLVDNHKYNDSLLATRLGIAEDVLIDVVGFVYPMDFVILDIEEEECMPLILGTPFLTTAKAEIKFDKGRMTIRAGNCKIRIVRTLKHPSKIKEKIKRDLDPITPVNLVNRRILEWEERIKNHQEKEMGLNKWRSKFEHEHVVQFRRTSMTGFPAQNVRSSNADALDSLYLLVLVIGTSQSKQHDKSESDSYYLSD